jgi:hypothetical protein
MMGKVDTYLQAAAKGTAQTVSGDPSENCCQRVRTASAVPNLAQVVPKLAKVAKVAKVVVVPNPATCANG